MTDAGAEGAVIVLPAGTYRVTKTLKAPSGLTLSGRGATIATFILDLGNTGSIAPCSND